MTKSNLSNTLSRQLVLASAALLLQIGAAAAADLAGDAQSQARALLSGATADRLTGAAVSNRVADRAASVPAMDAQELARRLLGGTPNVGTTTKKTTSLGVRPEGPRSREDAQTMARRMILGETVDRDHRRVGALTPRIAGA